MTMRRAMSCSSFRRRIPALGPVLAAVLMLCAQPAAHATNNSDTYRQLNLFGDVFERVRAQYVEEVSDEDLIEAAITGMLSSLDPHSGFLDVKAYKDMGIQAKGEFGGLGIEVTMENGLVKVVSPIDDTPAQRAGLLPGDLITHVNGEPVLGLSLGQAVERMRGPVDSTIVLSVRRESELPFDVTLVRAIIKIRSVRSRPIDQVGYVRITTFNEQTQSGLEEAVSGLQEEIGADLIGYVIDLRNNPGGLLDQAVSVSDSFLDQGEIVSTRGRDPKNITRVHATKGDIAAGQPLVVLINNGSASASEIVAGALQDHRRAVILGTRSFGKGSVQTVMPLSNQVAMRLTTARYYTPSGQSIQKTGISPDIEVPLARIEKVDSGPDRREADLRNALEGGARADPGGEPEQGAEEAAGPQQDYQIARAVDLLKGLHRFRHLAPAGRGDSD